MANVYDRIIFRDLGDGIVASLLATGGGSWFGWDWDGDGAKLTHRAPGAPVVRFTPAKAAEIRAAVATVRPDVFVRKYGDEFTDEDRARDDWVYVGVVADAHGLYQRLVQEATEATVALRKADLIAGG